MLIIVKGEDYELAERAAGVMWANQKTGEWGSGLREDACLIGRIGEVAFSMRSGLPIDAERIEGGDDQDFEHQCGATIELKTGERVKSVGLIKIRHHTGYYNPLTKAVYVFTQVIEHYPENKVASVKLWGWLTREDIINYFPGEWRARARNKNHKNLEIPYTFLRSMKGLL